MGDVVLELQKVPVQTIVVSGFDNEFIAIIALAKVLVSPYFGARI